MKPEQRAYLELHIAVLLFGFTAILGDLIQLSAMVMVWWRMLLTSVSLLFLIRMGRQLRKMPRSLVLQFMVIGVLVAMHWVCFFGAIKLSNASITLICMATTSLFTAFLEPMLLKQRIKGIEIFLGAIIIPGMAMVVNSTGDDMLAGILVGLLSAFLASLFATLNKKLVSKADSMSITFLELSSGWLFLTLLLPFFISSESVFMPSLADLGYLIILALLCTTLAYVLALRSLRHISAFASNLTVNLEPVYGIALAWVLLNEHQELDPGFYRGVILILAAVFSYPLIRRWQRRRQRLQS